MGQEFEKLGQSTGNSHLEKFGRTLQNTANMLSRTMSFAQVGSSAGGWGALIGAVVGFAVSGFETAAKERLAHEKKLQEIANAKIAQQNEYNRLLFEERMLHKENTSVFGTKEISNALDLLAVYNEKWNDLQEKITTPKMSSDEISRRRLVKQLREQAEERNPNLKEQSKNDIKWQKYLKELEAGRAGLSKLESIRVADGSYTTGAWFWKKSHTEWKGLTELYPQLIDQAGEFNVKVAKSILNNREFEGTGKQALQEIIDSYEQAQEAQKKFDEYLKNTFGELGKSIIDNVYNALQKGENAFESFAKSVGSVMGKLGKQLTYELYVAKPFEELQKKLQKAGKESSNSEDFARQSAQLVSNFSNAMKGKVSEMETFLKQWNEMNKANGFDFLNEQRKAVEKGFTHMSQDTGEELNGRFTLMTALEKQTVDGVKEMHQSLVSISERQLRHLANIDTNTYQLHQVKDDISGMKKDMAGVKRGIDELTTKGIKLKP